MIDLSKIKEGESADLGIVGELKIVLEWEQPKAGGFLGKLKDRFDTTDIDVSAILFSQGEAVDYVDPKEHRYALGGAVTHQGDVQRGTGEGSGETIIAYLSRIREQDADIDAIAIVASCARGGFEKIAGAVCRIYTDGGHRGNIRFSVTTGHTGALLAVVRKSQVGWTFAKEKAYGPGEGGWRALAGLAHGRVHA
jgi:stress response protein SCP2